MTCPQNYIHAFTDCQQCGSLCLGPTILSCGHCVCVLCVRRLQGHGENLSCLSCAHLVRWVYDADTELGQLLLTDPIVEDVVSERLTEQENVACFQCRSKNIGLVCLECPQFFCNECSRTHREQKKHYMQTLKHSTVIERVSNPQVQLTLTELKSFFERSTLGHGITEDTKDICCREARVMYDLMCQLKEAERAVDLYIARLDESKAGLVKKQNILGRYALRLSKTDDVIVKLAKLVPMRLRRVYEYCSPLGLDKGQRSICYLCNCHQDSSGAAVSQTWKSVYFRKVEVVGEKLEISVKRQRDDPQVQVQVPEEEITPLATPVIKAQRVEVVSRITTVDLDLGAVQLETLTDENVLKAAINILLAKVDWTKNPRIQKLESEKRRLEFQIQELEKERLRIEEELENEKKKAEGELAANEVQQDAEMREEHKKMKTFALRLEGRDRLLADVLKQIDGGSLSQVVRRLLDDFNIRLLGLDCGLNFLMEAPVAVWTDALKEKFLHVEQILEELVPKEERKNIMWHNVKLCDSGYQDELALGKPSPVQELSDRKIRDKTYRTRGSTITDMMTCLPRLENIKIQNDKYCPKIECIITTSHGHLVMADSNNNKVLVYTDPQQTKCNALKLHVEPWRLAQMHDGLVAVTTDTRCIHIIDVTGQPSVVSQLHTDKQYVGVGVDDKDHLVVSCIDGTCCIDILSREGEILKTLIPCRQVSVLKRFVSKKQIKILSRPQYLCVIGGDVLVSDSKTDSVYRLELSTGRVIATLKHPDLKRPCQVTSDQAGNIYVASYDSCYVLVVNVAGQWRQLLYGPEHGKGNSINPVGVHASGRRLWVSWSEGDSVYTAIVGRNSVVTQYLIR